MLDFVDRWLERTLNSEGKHNVLVFSKKLFPIVAEKCKGRNDIAYISIDATDECAEFYLLEDNFHYLPSDDNVFNVDFDDLDADREYKGHVFKAISQEQADEMVGFIDKNTDKHIIVHCKAGQSRSQGVFRYIMDCYPDFYEECEENKVNPCITPNAEVVRKLKRAYYKKNGFFTD